MKSEQMKKSFVAFLNNYHDDLNQLLNQVLNNELTWNFEVDEKNLPAAVIRKIEYPQVAIRASLNSGSIVHLFLLTPDSVLNIYSRMMGGEPDLKVGPDHLDGLKEIANQVIGQIQSMTQGSGLSLKIDDVVCSVIENASDSVKMLPDDGNGLSAIHTLKQANAAITIYQFYEVKETIRKPASDNFASGNEPLSPADVHPAEFQNFKTEGVDLASPRNIDMLMDVEMEIYVELGKKTMLVKDILKLGKGSVVELEKAAGEPLGIFVNGRKLAEGEVVVVDDHFGIRITQLAGTKERIKSLG